MERKKKGSQKEKSLRGEGERGSNRGGRFTGEGLTF